MVQPGGPNIHFRTSSDLVCASHTNFRGALKVRTTRTSRSLGEVTSTGFGMVLLLLLSYVREGTALFLAALALARFGFELFEQRVEALVVLLPDLAVVLDPARGFLQSLRLQTPRPPLSV